MKRLITTLFCTMIAFVLMAQNKPIKGTGFCYFSSDAFTAAFVPNTIEDCEIAYTIDKQETWCWNRNTTAWQLCDDDSGGANIQVVTNGVLPVVDCDGTDIEILISEDQCFVDHYVADCENSQWLKVDRDTVEDVCVERGNTSNTDGSTTFFQRWERCDGSVYFKDTIIISGLPQCDSAQILYHIGSGWSCADFSIPSSSIVNVPDGGCTYANPAAPTAAEVEACIQSYIVTNNITKCPTIFSIVGSGTAADPDWVSYFGCDGSLTNIESPSCVAPDFNSVDTNCETDLQVFNCETGLYESILKETDRTTKKLYTYSEVNGTIFKRWTGGVNAIQDVDDAVNDNFFWAWSGGDSLGYLTHVNDPDQIGNDNDFTRRVNTPVNTSTQWSIEGYVKVEEGGAMFRDRGNSFESVTVFIGQCCGAGQIVSHNEDGNFDDSLNDPQETWNLAEGLHYTRMYVSDRSQGGWINLEWSLDGGTTWVNVPTANILREKPTITEREVIYCEKSGILYEDDGSTVVTIQPNENLFRDSLMIECVYSHNDYTGLDYFANIKDSVLTIKKPSAGLDEPSVQINLCNSNALPTMTVEDGTNAVALDVFGVAQKTTGTLWVNTSDERTKEDIQPFEFNLEEINKVAENIKVFKYKKSFIYGFDENAENAKELIKALPEQPLQVGLIAQDLERAGLSKYVKEGGELKSVDLNELLYLLIISNADLRDRLNKIEKQ